MFKILNEIFTNFYKWKQWKMLQFEFTVRNFAEVMLFIYLYYYCIIWTIGIRPEPWLKGKNSIVQALSWNQFDSVQRNWNNIQRFPLYTSLFSLIPWKRLPKSLQHTFGFTFFFSHFMPTCNLIQLENKHKFGITWK